MPKEDHEIKRAFIEGDPELSAEKKAVEERSKIDNFVWDDDEENSEAVPLTPDINEIDTCVSALAGYVLNNLSTECFQGMATEGIRFVIPIPLDLHPLLPERYSDDWTLSSQLLVFQCIRDQFLAEFADADRRSELDQKITEALPPSHRKKFTSGTLHLFDDAMVMDDEGNSITVEVPIEFVAN